MVPLALIFLTLLTKVTILQRWQYWQKWQKWQQWFGDISKACSKRGLGQAMQRILVNDQCDNIDKSYEIGKSDTIDNVDNNDI